LEVKLSQRASTGIDGIDRLIEGGIPRGNLVLLTGSPGTGKTILTSHYLYEGLKAGEPGIYASFAEDKSQFFSNMERLGFDFPRYEEATSFRFLELITTTEEGMGYSITEILKAAEESNAKRLVIDSYSVIAQSFEKSNDVRILLHTILGKLTRLYGVTSILIGEETSTGFGPGSPDFVADGVISLSKKLEQHQLHRRVEILKMRGTQLNATQARYGIKNRGIVVYSEPVLNAGDYAPSDQRLSSGVGGLDDVLNGGYPKCTTTLIAGASGTGKTTLAMHFINEARIRDETALYLSYEDTPRQVLKLASGFGWNFQQFVEKATGQILSFDIEQSNLDDHLSEISAVLERMNPSRLVVDSIDPLKRVYPDEDFIRFIKGLCAESRRLGATSVFTAFSEPTSISMGASGISSLIDTTISLRDVELSSTLKRSLVIFKARGTDLSRDIREFVITPKGIVVKEKFKNAEQILSGAARRTATDEMISSWGDAFSKGHSDRR
jgi:circadian clock protein KaiC